MRPKAQTTECINALKGHTNTIPCISFSHDGKLLSSISLDGTIRLWRCDTWETVQTLDEPSPGRLHSSTAFHPNLSILAIVGAEDMVIHVCELDTSAILGINQTAGAERPAGIMEAAIHATRYSNAKVVVTSEAGVERRWQFVSMEQLPLSYTAPGSLKDSYLFFPLLLACAKPFGV